MRELLDVGIDLDKIGDRTFREVADIIGIEAAIELFGEYRGAGLYCSKAYIRDLEYQYLQKLSTGKTERQLARILDIPKSTINRLMNEVPGTAAYKKYKETYIPMFPELEDTLASRAPTNMKPATGCREE